MERELKWMDIAAGRGWLDRAGEEQWELADLRQSATFYSSVRALSTHRWGQGGAGRWPPFSAARGLWSRLLPSRRPQPPPRLSVHARNVCRVSNAILGHPHLRMPQTPAVQKSLGLKETTLQLAEEGFLE